MLLFLGTVLAAAPAAVYAEIAVLENGQTLKIERHEAIGDVLFLVLDGGGRVGTAPAHVRGFVPDELADELLQVRDVAAGSAALGDLRALASAIARRYGLEPELVLAVVAVESSFRSDAVSPKGAQGLMQLMPRTADSLGVHDVFDPEQNLDGGVRHLRTLVDRYDGDLTRALAAYNAGEAAVERYGGIPPFAETQDYVREVIDRYEHGR
jgi:soluble lytic murein transglycosylase-like protein